MPLRAIRTDTTRPLYRIIGEIAGLWVLVSLGYYVAFPLLGISIGYNTSPIIMAVYFTSWAVLCAYILSDLLKYLPTPDTRLRFFLILGLFTTLVIFASSLLTLLSPLVGPVFSPYTDLLFANPSFFVAKGAEVLVQQILLAGLVVALARQYHTLRSLLIGYFICFGGMHMFLFFFTSAPTYYLFITTGAALISTLLFPYLITRVRSGIMYTYMLHMSFYFLLALFLQVFPPAGYTFL